MRDPFSHQSHSDAQSAAKPRILVVDDEAGSRRVIARTLEAAGFLAREASDGEDALAAVAEELPDLVLLDLNMPNLNGAQTCAGLRANPNPAVNELPIVMLTAHDDEQAEVRCLEAGANDFLAKPVGRATLTARIQTQMRIRAMSLKLRAQNEQLAQWQESQRADLEAAKITQRAIIPTRPPSIEGWKIENHFSPVIQVGGDIYGWRVLEQNRCIVWMADATGHGASAALLTTLIAHLFHQASFLTQEPDAILKEVNAEFFGLFHGKSFITACCAVLDSSGRVTFCSAGHPPVLIARHDGRIESVMAQATVIGITGDLPAAGSVTELEPDDVLLLFTDGLYSLRHPSGDRMMCYTVGEVLPRVLAQRPLMPDLLKRMEACGNGEPFDDDVTVISVRRVGSH